MSAPNINDQFWQAAIGRLKTMEPQERFDWAVGNFKRPALTTSFGARAISSIDMYAQAGRKAGRRLNVIAVDTGFVSPETQIYAAKLQKTYQDVLDFRIYGSGKSSMQIIFEHGLYTGKEDKPLVITKDQTLAINEITKEKPMRDAFRELQADAWVSGLTPDEELRDRREVPFLTFGHKFNVLEEPIPKICAYADKDRKWLHNYIKDHELPMNEHHSDWTRNYTGHIVCGVNEAPANDPGAGI